MKRPTNRNWKDKKVHNTLLDTSHNTYFVILIKQIILALKQKHKNRTITICSSYIGDILGYVCHLWYKNLVEQNNSTWFKNELILLYYVSLMYMRRGVLF